MWISLEPEAARHLVVGGDEENINLWMSDREGQVWRKSVPLPYGEGQTSYGATLVNKEDKVGFIFNVTELVRMLSFSIIHCRFTWPEGIMIQVIETVTYEIWRTNKLSNGSFFRWHSTSRKQRKNLRAESAQPFQGGRTGLNRRHRWVLSCRNP